MASAPLPRVRGASIPGYVGPLRRQRAVESTGAMAPKPGQQRLRPEHLNARQLRPTSFCM
eukprot:789566-Pyramimonas_sp.AAC.1